MLYIKINNLLPAPYNPRKISDEKFNLLVDSIKRNGFVLPVLVNQKNHVLIAGHQRIKAAKILGLDEVPCFFVNSDTHYLNQLHNALDDDKEAVVKVLDFFPVGFSVQNSAKFNVLNSSPKYSDRIEKLILRYGNVFCAVVDNNDVILGSNYIKAAQNLKFPVNISKIENPDKQLLQEKYGVYDYQNLEKFTWNQALSQMSNRPQRSVLYNRFVLPYLKTHNNLRVLDFGCGKGHYISHVRDNNLASCAVGLEFYNILANSQFDFLKKTIETEGLFDVVILDNVINSIDSLDAEKAVLASCIAFLKLNGLLFCSGRTYYRLFLDMLDDNGFYGNFRNGIRFYQKFHYENEIKNKIHDNGFGDILYHNNTLDTFQISCKKLNSLSLDVMKSAIDFEFNLPLPNGKSFNKNKEIWQVILNKYLQ